MTHVAIVGCGIVGAAIAYELSEIPGLSVTVFDRQPPAQASTGAALGVLMGAISQKTRGNNLRLRRLSIERYNAWIPALEAATGQAIRFNRQGILRLCFEGEDLARWQQLAAVRQTQGWPIEILDCAQLTADYPQLNLEQVTAAIYSPCDRQVDPTALTLALVAAAAQKGVTFQFDTIVTGIPPMERITHPSESAVQRCQSVETSVGLQSIDWLVIAAGLGSTPLTAALQQPVDIRPVLGQAAQVKLHSPLGKSTLQPVITGDDVHIVPLGQGEYWVGATVEFPTGTTAATPSGPAFDAVMYKAIAFCPALADATIVRTWSGLRPRPEGRPAPIVERLPGYENVLLATGHYRNGVLLAPATAVKIRQMIDGDALNDKTVAHD